MYKNTSINYNKKCDKCKIEMHIERKECTKINGVLIYVLNVVFINEMNYVVTTTLNVPNAEGYFVPNILTLNPGVTQTQLYFFPDDNFEIDQDIVVSLNGSYDSGTCYNETRINLPDCRDLGKSASTNLMVLMPNPAKEKTQVLYDITTKGELSLQVSDMLGTIYYTKQLKTNKGVVYLDLRNFSFGVYDISIIQNGKAIVHQKLIKE